MIKDLVKNLKPSSTLLINEESRRLEKEGKNIYKFGFGQSPFQVPEDIVSELKKNAHHNKYLPMQGLLELRNAIAKFESSKKKNKFNSSNIIIGPEGGFTNKEISFAIDSDYKAVSLGNNRLRTETAGVVCCQMFLDSNK